MRAHVMRTGQLSLVIVVLSAIPAMWDSSSAAPPAEVPVKDVFLPSKRELFLPPYLETEDDLSMHAGYYGGGAPGRDPYSHFGMTKYLSMPNGVIFLSGEGFITQNARGGATALLHTRQLLGEGLLGTGISYSVHESMADGIFEQSAVHVEMFPSDEWSFRANAYVPTGNRSQQIFNSGPIPGLPGFAGNNIAVPTVTTTMSEAAMRGYELEAARKLGVWAAEVFGTYYRYFGRNGGPNTEGARVGLRGYVSRRLSANVNVSDDPLFGTNVFGGFTWNFGGGAALAPSNIRDKLTIPVERHRQIVLNNAANMIPGIVTVTNGGIPITVTHVQQGAGGANIGTFEDPFNTNGVLPTQPTQIVYVHSGGTYVNGYTLDTDQRALAEGGFSPHIINTDQFGPTFLPPGNGGFIRPTINGTITAANGSEISNFAMAPAGTSVSLPGLAGSVNVNRTTVTGGTTAVDVIGGSGTFTFTDVQIADPTTTGISIATRNHRK